MKRLFVSCLGVLFVLDAQADMYSALQVVYDNNPVIVGARTAVGAAAADLKLARSGMRPYLGITGAAGVARTEILGNDYDTVPTGVGAQFQQNIFAGGAIVAGIKAARGVLASQRAQLHAKQQEIFLDAINAYVNVLNARQVLDLNKNNQRVLQEYYDFVSQRVDVGMLTATDKAQAAARLSGAEYALADAQAQYDNAVQTLRRVYGRDFSQYDDIELDVVEDEFPDTRDEAIEYARIHHPVLVALRAQEDAACENIVTARQSAMPSIDVRGSLMQFDDMPIVDRVRDGRIGVYLSVPLFDKGASAARVEKVRFTVDGIGQQMIDAERVIIQNINQAWNTLDAQVVAIDAGRASVRANRLALDGVKDAQSQGRRTVLDVLNAEQELLNSRVNLTRAQHGRVAAYFAVLAAMGKLTPDCLGLDADDSDE